MDITIIRVRVGSIFPLVTEEVRLDWPHTWRCLTTTVGNPDKLRQRETGIQSRVYCVLERSCSVVSACNDTVRTVAAGKLGHSVSDACQMEYDIFVWVSNANSHKSCSCVKIGVRLTVTIHPFVNNRLYI
jgi:hypothetical protein